MKLFDAYLVVKQIKVPFILTFILFLLILTLNRFDKGLYNMATWLVTFLVSLALNTVLMIGLLYLVVAMVIGRKYSKVKVAFTISLFANFIGGIFYFVPFFPPLISSIIHMFIWGSLIRHYFEDWLPIFVTLVVFMAVVYLILGAFLGVIFY